MELAQKLRPLSVADAHDSYKDLRAYDCKSPPGHSRYGLKALDYFFLAHRLKAKTKRHISFYEAIHNPTLNAKLNTLVRRWKRGRTLKNQLSAKYDVFQLYYGTINQFRPAMAKYMYCKLNARVGILDFSAGWGGRALAAMSLGIPYYGFDANTHLANSYTRMVDTLEPSASVHMTFKPSETADFSTLKYDLVFTSPPYFTIEEYEKMPEYGSKQGFLDIFFKPVTLNAWRYLRPGGAMALNMPSEMYDAVKGLLPRLAKRFRMPLKNRHPRNAAAQRSLGSTNTSAEEYIYVWYKGKQGTRKIKKTARHTRKIHRTK
jgi:hypothetical protein